MDIDLYALYKPANSEVLKSYFPQAFEYIFKDSSLAGFYNAYRPLNQIYITHTYIMYINIIYVYIYIYIYIYIIYI